jgi:RNA polymerase sigma-70 factor (ECF subfamily)
VTGDAFEPHRAALVALAYRMLGSLAEAEDVVQDAYVRWRGVDATTVAAPRAYLARVVSRLCLDRMKSARAQREIYVGTWLPEPVVDASGAAIAEDLSVALLRTLERLSPLERAAFLLHDVFDMDYPEVAEVLERSEAACRQLAARARDHVRDDRPRFAASPDARVRLAAAFRDVMATGDVAKLTSLLADDAVFYSDGGGKRLAALNPIYGRERIVRFLAGVTGKRGLPVRVDDATINGLPGFVLHSAEGIETLALECTEEHVVAIYVVRNPDKLRHLAQ